VIGDMYQADKLKKASLRFISSNTGSVFKSKDWKEGLKDHPNLMADVIDAMARNK